MFRLSDHKSWKPKCINKQDMTVFLTKQFSFNKTKIGSIYRIVPNRRAVREWEGLGARLLISQKWDECGHPLDQRVYISKFSR